MYIAHIGAMDAYARGLKAAAALKTDGVYDKWRAERYATFDSGIGAKIEAGKTSFAVSGSSSRAVAMCTTVARLRGFVLIDVYFFFREEYFYLAILCLFFFQCVFPC